MRRALVLFLVVAAAASSFAAIDYDRFTHPKGDFSVAYPSGWERSAVGMGLLSLKPAGYEGLGVQVLLEDRSDVEESPSAFLQRMLDESEGSRQLLARSELTLGGRKAQRLEFRETAVQKGLYGETLPGPLSEVYIVLPLEKHFYVLTLRGLKEPFKRTLPEFDRIAKSLTVKP